MILLERKKPHKYLMLEAIMRRLPKSNNQYTYFENMLQRIQAGFAGERQVDREWSEIKLPCKSFLLHNLELRNEQGYTHQIDTLFLCPYFLFIVEVKNIVGQVELEAEKHQFTRKITDGKVDGFRNPFDQLLRHHKLLKGISQKHGVKIPIEHAVVSANPNMIMTSSLSNHPIFHVA